MSTMVPMFDIPQLRIRACCRTKLVRAWMRQKQWPRNKKSLGWTLFTSWYYLASHWCWLIRFTCFLSVQLYLQWCPMAFLFLRLETTQQLPVWWETLPNWSGQIQWLKGWPPEITVSTSIVNSLIVSPRRGPVFLAQLLAADTLLSVFNIHRMLGMICPTVRSSLIWHCFNSIGRPKRITGLMPKRSSVACPLEPATAICWMYWEIPRPLK